MAHGIVNFEEQRQDHEEDDILPEISAEHDQPCEGWDSYNLLTLGCLLATYCSNPTMLTFSRRRWRHPRILESSGSQKVNGMHCRRGRPRGTSSSQL